MTECKICGRQEGKPYAGRPPCQEGWGGSAEMYLQRAKAFEDRGCFYYALRGRKEPIDSEKLIAGITPTNVHEETKTGPAVGNEFPNGETQSKDRK